MSDDPKTLVSTQWLSKHLKDPDLRILDASWYLPDMRRDGWQEYNRSHIPGARFFDIAEISDTRSTLPHMAPPSEKFVSRMKKLGVGDGHQIVVYDGAGIFSAARVWWIFRLMGKADVAVLDGGYPKWLSEKRETEDMEPFSKARHMTIQRQAHLVRNVTQVAEAAKLGTHTILDARSAKRFKGTEPEPRPGMRAGHIPGSVNLPYRSLLNANGTMKSKSELKEAFHDSGADLTKPIITTCGSGISAAIISLALERIGIKKHALYDGSWSEWGQFDELPIKTGS